MSVPTPEKRTGPRRGVLFAVAVLGGLSVPIVPPLGVVVLAAALTALLHAAGPRSGLIALLAATTTTALLFGPAALVATAFLGAVGLWLATRMREISPWTALWESSLAAAVALVLSEATSAALSGTTIISQARTAADAAASLATAALSGITGAGQVEAEVVADYLFRVAPADYVLTGFLTGLFMVLAVGWAGERVGVRMRRLPGLAELDLDARILVAPLIALAALILSRPLGDNVVAATIGLNILLAVRPLFLWQGLGVVAHRLDKAGTGRGARGVALVLLVAIDALTLLVSLLGLLDIWFNFRRLSRSDDEIDSPLRSEESGT